MSDQTAERIQTECTACRARFRVPAASLGRQAKCPKCSEVFTIEDHSIFALAPEEPAAGEASSAMDELARAERSAQPDRAQQPDQNGSTCPQCGATMPMGAALCVSCGFNTMTGKKVRPAVGKSAAAGALSSIAKGAGTFAIGCALSMGGALIGAAVWFAIAAVTNFEIGYIAWGLGGLAGLGMAYGYKQQNLRAGIAAAAFALVGILIAKGGMFFYWNYSDIKEVQRQLSLIGTESDAKRWMVATELANRRANQRGIAPFDDRRGGFVDEEYDKLAALADDEFEGVEREYESWNAGKKWEDQRFVRDYVVYGRISLMQQAHDQREAATELGHPQPDGAAADSPTNDQIATVDLLNITAQEWRRLYTEVKQDVDNMTDEECVAEARALNEDEERSQLVARLAAHFSELDAMKQGVSTTGKDWEAHYETRRAEFNAKPLDELAKEVANVDAWDNGGKLEDEEYVRNALIYAHIYRNIWDDQAYANQDEEEESYDEEWEDHAPEVWTRNYNNAVAEIDQLTPQERREQLAESESDTAIDAFREQIRQNATKAVAGEAASFFFKNYFGIIDVIFVLLALGTAFKLAAGGEENV